jgi:hypothetical protein
MMRFRIATAVLGAVLGGLASAAAAGSVQVALVESVTGRSAGVQFLDYLEAGKLITLGPRDTIVISYMRSCVQETITGGIVRVGHEQSEVDSGQVRRSKLQCAPGRVQLGEGTFTLAGTVLRGMSRQSGPAVLADAAVTLYGASPMLELAAPGKVIIERIDRPGERIVVDVSKEHLARGSFYDFAQTGKSLAAGGVYRASFGAREMVFRIDPLAQPGRTPILGRLLRFVVPS